MVVIDQGVIGRLSNGTIHGCAWEQVIGLRVELRPVQKRG
jgi:hypothetical protein